MHRDLSVHDFKVVKERTREIPGKKFRQIMGDDVGEDGTGAVKGGKEGTKESKEDMDLKVRLVHKSLMKPEIRVTAMLPFLIRFHLG